MKRLLVVTVAVLALIAGAWSWLQREWLAAQYASYRVGAASTFQQAAQELQWFEKHDHRERALQQLVARFGTGSDRFDDHLVAYAYDGRSSDDFRSALSLEFAWRPELLPLWAEHWQKRQENVDEEIGTVRNYLEALAMADPPRDVTWRDILDIQAAMQLTRHGNLAQRLTPRNWRSRFKRWNKVDVQEPTVRR